VSAFTWFTDDDNEIVGDDICSKCLKTIDEDEVPLMLFREHPERSGRGSVDVARFHWSCADQLIRAGIIKFAAIRRSRSP
jgi:hypothetical protein